MLGADSTASAFISQSGFHYLNHNQKLFEVGSDSTLGVVTWGLGSIANLSHRTQIALLDDDLKANPAATVLEAANRFGRQIQPTYQATYGAELAQCQTLSVKPPYDPSLASPSPAARTKDEESEFNNLRLGLSLGFCLAGFITPNRSASAAIVQFDPANGGAASVAPLSGIAGFWGAPKIFERLIKGRDPEVRNDILSSGKWSGSEQDLDGILQKQELNHLTLPIREAVDFVHVCIYTTIKAMKFSAMSQICGGPIELATITTDRKFRWVRHKEWDSAILDGENR